MKKKAALEWSLGTILMGGILFLFILVITSIAIGYLFTGKIFLFGYSIPGFETADIIVENTQILGYNIETGRVGYYDGTDWIAFEEGGEGKDSSIKLGGNLIYHRKAQEDFEKFYYEGERPPAEIKLFEPRNRVINKIYTENLDIITANELRIITDLDNENKNVDLEIVSVISPDLSSIELPKFSNTFTIVRAHTSYKEGDIRALLLREDGKGDSAIGFILDTNNILKLDADFIIEETTIENLRFTRPIENYQDPLLLSIYNGMKNWRDAVFDNPIEIRIGEKDNVKRFCTRKIDKYITIDLSKLADKSYCDST